MPDSLYCISDRFFVNDPALSEFYKDAVTFFDQALKHFCLNFAHKPYMYFLRFLYPHDMKLRFLLFQAAQIIKHPVDVAAFRKFKTVGQHRFQHGDIRV